MANTFSDNAKLWQLSTADIVSFRNHSNHNSGLVGVWIRKVRFRPNATGDGVQFQTLQVNSTATLSVATHVVTVSNTSRITDADSGGIFDGAVIGQWVRISWTSTGNNKGWYYVTAVDATKHYVEVENGTDALTNETSKTYTLDFYTPEVCMVLVSPTGDTGAKLIQAEELDFGDVGRYFPNLGMTALSASGNVDVYLK